MSVLTALLALAPLALRAKFEPKPEPEVETDEYVIALRRRIAELERDNKWLREQHRSARAHIDWLNERLYAPRPAVAAQQMAQAQYQQGLADFNAQMAMRQQLAAQQAMQNAQNFQALGAQMLDFCNCVPARHDMFLRSGLGDGS